MIQTWEQAETDSQPSVGCSQPRVRVGVGRSDDPERPHHRWTIAAPVDPPSGPARTPNMSVGHAAPMAKPCRLGGPLGAAHAGQAGVLRHGRVNVGDGDADPVVDEALRRLRLEVRQDGAGRGG